MGLITAIAFAANSVLNRAALEAELIDPSLFSLIRIASAAIVLAIILALRGDFAIPFGGHWKSSIFLVIYVFGFSIAYSFVTSATGALILFATVQFVMIGSGYLKGLRLNLLEWGGILVSFIGFLLLLLPGIDSPPTVGLLLMIVSGFGWALFSLSGLESRDALYDVGVGFIKATPIALVLSLIFVSHWHVSSIGVLLALASGVLASGLGYCIWYLMLPLITSATAAVFQLLVPVIVAVLGVLILGEAFSSRLILAGGLVILGLALYTLAKNLKQRPN